MIRCRAGLVVLAATLLTSVGATRATPANEGLLDETFDGPSTGNGRVNLIDSMQDGGVRAIAVRPDGKIVVAGPHDTNTLVAGNSVRVHQILPNGNSDSDFDGSSGGNGKVLYPGGSYTLGVSDMALQNDGKILVTGSRDDNIAFMSNSYVLRLNADGTVDGSFGSASGMVTVSVGSLGGAVAAIALQPDGKILLAGWALPPGASSSQPMVVRLTSSGARDPTFGDNGVAFIDVGTSGSAYDMVLQPDGKIVVGGSGTSPAATSGAFMVARFKSDGSKDTTFSNGAGFLLLDLTSGVDSAQGLGRLSNGTLVLAGVANLNDASNDDDTAVAWITSSGLLDVRYPDGAPDGTEIYDLRGLGLDDLAYALAVQSDDHVVVVGSAMNSSPNTDFFTMRMGADGYLDGAFGGAAVQYVSLSSNEVAYDVAIQPDNRILVTGGNNSTQRFVVVRYNATTYTSSLSGLVPSSGSVSPVISSDVTSYTVTVPNGIKSVTLSPTLTDRNSTMTFDGAPLASGSASAAIPLSVGSTTVPIVVTSQRSIFSSTDYTVTITRLTGSVRKNRTMTARAAMISADRTIPRGAKVRVKSLTSRVCRSSGQSIKGLKIGTCRVRITVTPKRTRANPRPKATSTVVTIRVV